MTSEPKPLPTNLTEADWSGSLRRRVPWCECAEPRLDRVATKLADGQLGPVIEQCCACGMPSQAQHEATVARIMAEAERNGAAAERCLEAVGAMLTKLALGIEKVFHPVRCFMADTFKAGVPEETAVGMVRRGLEVAAAWSVLPDGMWCASLAAWRVREPWSPWLLAPLRPTLFAGCRRPAKMLGKLGDVEVGALVVPEVLTLDMGAEHPELGEGVAYDETTGTLVVVPQHGNPWESLEAVRNFHAYEDKSVKLMLAVCTAEVAERLRGQVWARTPVKPKAAHGPRESVEKPATFGHVHAAFPAYDQLANLTHEDAKPPGPTVHPRPDEPASVEVARRGVVMGIDPGVAESTALAVVESKRDPEGEWVMRIVEWIPLGAKRVVVACGKHDGDLAWSVAAKLRERGAAASTTWMHNRHVETDQREIETADVVLAVSPTEAQLLKARGVPLDILFRDDTTIPAGTRFAGGDVLPFEPARCVAHPSKPAVVERAEQDLGFSLDPAYAHAPGSLDAFPVGQAPSEQAFARSLAKPSPFDAVLESARRFPVLTPKVARAALDFLDLYGPRPEPHDPFDTSFHVTKARRAEAAPRVVFDPTRFLLRSEDFACVTLDAKTLKPRSKS